jgi:hypothetical protein
MGEVRPRPEFIDCRQTPGKNALASSRTTGHDVMFTFEEMNQKPHTVNFQRFSSAVQQRP